MNDEHHRCTHEMRTPDGVARAYTPDMKPDLSKIDLDSIVWQRSSFSNGAGGMCAEVALLEHGGSVLRDSKNPNGPMLAFSANEWDALLDGAAAGEFRFPA